LGPRNTFFSSSSDSEVGGCKKLPKGIKEEEIGPKTTAPPPGTTRKNQPSLTSPVCQVGSCDKLPKGIEEEKIVAKQLQRHQWEERRKGGLQAGSQGKYHLFSQLLFLKLVVV
jgi:hypothetical protein